MTLRCLADSSRRRLLRRLTEERNGVVTIDELCEDLADGTPPEEVKTELFHVHLPSLSDADLVDVDWEEETVRYRVGQQSGPLVESVVMNAET